MVQVETPNAWKRGRSISLACGSAMHDSFVVYHMQTLNKHMRLNRREAQKCDLRFDIVLLYRSCQSSSMCILSNDSSENLNETSEITANTCWPCCNYRSANVGSIRISASQSVRTKVIFTLSLLLLTGCVRWINRADDSSGRRHSQIDHSVLNAVAAEHRHHGVLVDQLMSDQSACQTGYHCLQLPVCHLLTGQTVDLKENAGIQHILSISSDYMSYKGLHDAARLPAYTEIVPLISHLALTASAHPVTRAV